MSNEISEELLSAYFDGELTVKERTRVEQWLQTNPEGKQALADFRRLSRVFEGLPRQEVPQEFAAEVLQVAERRMLLPESRVVFRRKTFPMRMAAICCGSAAMLLLSVGLYLLRPEPEPSIPRPVADTNPVGQSNVKVPSDTPRQNEFVVNTPRSTEPELDPPRAETLPVDDLPPKEELYVDRDTDDDIPLTDPQDKAAQSVEIAFANLDQPEQNRPDVAVLVVQVDSINQQALLQKLLLNFHVKDEGRPDTGLEPFPHENAGRPAADDNSHLQGIVVAVTDKAQLVAVFSELLKGRESKIQLYPQPAVYLKDFGDPWRRKIESMVNEVAEVINTTAPRQPTAKKGDKAPEQPGAVSVAGGKEPSRPARAFTSRQLKRWFDLSNETVKQSAVRPNQKSALEDASRLVKVELPAGLRLELPGDSKPDDPSAPATSETGGTTPTEAAENDSTRAGVRPESAGPTPGLDPRVFRVLVIVKTPVAESASVKPVDAGK
ncbi:MAG: hypothetical protein JSS02_06425 [Planctomycetes bacterium]|nr:hypothetical protein [Planctomycetota bacterium]